MLKIMKFLLWLFPANQLVKHVFVLLIDMHLTIQLIYLIHDIKSNSFASESGNCVVINVE